MAEIEGDTEATVNACLLSKGLRFTACAWRASCNAVRGIKTIIAAGGIGLLGLYDEVGGADLLGKLKEQFGEDARIGPWLMGIGVLFIVLRCVTKTSVGRGSTDSDEGDTINH